MEARVFFSESLEGRLGTRQRSTTLSKPHGPACQAGAQGQDQGDEEGPIDVRSHSVGLICPVNGEEEELVARSTCGLTRAWSDGAYDQGMQILSFTPRISSAIRW